MRRYLAILPFLLLAAAAPQPVLNGDSISVSAGGGSARTLPARALDTINVLDLPGIKADTQTSTSNATMTLGSNTLTLSSGVFTSADVGKYIVVAGAGPSSATGQLMSVPVTAAGSYTVAPTASASGSPTTPAVIQVVTALQTPTVNNNGGGLCTNGTYTATVSGGTYFRQSQVTVTVASGNLTTISLLDGGAYTTAPSLTGAALSGLGSCTATANFAGLGIYKVLMMQPGNGYALAGTVVSLSGGTGSAATLGTPVVKASQSSLASTITGYVSPTRVTLADNAATAITSSTVGIWWGHDDASAINTAGTTLCTGYGGRLYFPQLPTGYAYGIASPLNACTRYSELDLDGQGTLATRIVALQYLDAMVAGATSNVPINIHSLTLEGAGVVRHLVNIYQGKEITIRDVMGRNVAAPKTYSNAAQGSLVWATTSQILLGNSGYVGNTLEVTIDDSNRFENELYIAPTSWPNYGIEVYGTDNKFGEFSIVNIQSSGIWDLSGGNNRFHGTHVFNYFSGQDQPTVRPTYCAYSKGNVSFINTACDGAISSAYYIVYAFAGAGGAYHTEVIGNRTWWGVLNETGGGKIIGESNSYGVTLESGVAGAVVVGNAVPNAYSGDNVVVQLGTADDSTIVGLNPNANYAAGVSSTVSSGTGGFSVVSGSNVAASGFGSQSWGQDTRATSNYSRSYGFRTRDKGGAGRNCSGYGEFALQGDQQACSTVHAATTTTTSQAELTVGAGNLAFANLAVLGNGQDAFLSGSLQGRCVNGGTITHNAWSFTGFASRTSGGVTTIIGTPVFTSIGGDVIGTPALIIDGTYDLPAIAITPAAAITCHWLARFDSAEGG